MEHDDKLEKIRKILEEKYNKVEVILEEEKRDVEMKREWSQRKESETKIKEKENYEHQMNKDCLQNKIEEEHALNLLKYGINGKREGYSIKKKLDFESLGGSRVFDTSANLEEDHVNDEKILPTFNDINLRPLADLVSPNKC